MESTADFILDATLMCLDPYHKKPRYGDRNGMDVFCRLLAKNILGIEGLSDLHLMIVPSQIRSERIEYSTSDLLNKFRTAHPRKDPKCTTAPLIVAVYEGRERLLDGNTRLNYWRQRGDNNMHVVHVHRIEGTGELVNLLPVM